MSHGTKGILITAVGTGALFWFAKRVNSASDYWQLLAQISGLFGLFTLSWTYILAIRHKTLEQMFGGLDKVYRLHHTLGGAAFLLVIHHPVFLVLRQLPTNTLRTYFVPTGLFSYALGIYALYVFLVLLVLTLYVDLPYRIWKQTHEWMGLVIILGAWHGLLVASDMASFWPLTVWMSMWSIAALSAFVYKRFLYYRWEPGELYFIDDTTWDKDIVVLSLRAKQEGRYQVFAPGQFGFLSFDEPGKRRDEHPFSVLSQDGDRVTFGIKVTGGFTLQLARSLKDTVVRIRGPFGSFGANRKSSTQNVWIAGGIGITPFVYLLSAVAATERVTFVFTIRGASPGVLMQTVMDVLPNKPFVRFVVHDSKTSGRLTAEKLAGYAPISSDTRVWLCGPQQLMESLTEQLPALGVRRSHIYFEDFALR